MAEKVTTETLMQRIFKTKQLRHFLRANEMHLREEPFHAYLQRLCLEKGLVPERVILAAQIDRTYGHQLFNGTRRPSRDKVLQLALAMGLPVDETQKLLRAAGKSGLYPRIRRDAALLYCLNRSFSVSETQEILSGYEMTLLGEVRRDGD